jgi:hypothetical protein
LFNRIARWYIFKPNIPLWAHFGTVVQRKMLVNFMAIRSSSLPFWYIFSVLVCCTKKIWQPCCSTFLLLFLFAFSEGNSSLIIRFCDRVSKNFIVVVHMTWICRKRKNIPFPLEQGCQIFLYLIYQNGGKYTKLPLNYQRAIKYIKWQ